MAVLHRTLTRYLKVLFANSLEQKVPPYRADPLLMRLCAARMESREQADITLPPKPFSGRQSAAIVNSGGIIEAFQAAFPDGVVGDGAVDRQSERRLVALKKGFPNLPATTASVIIKGFGFDLSEDEVLGVFASHGLSRNMRALAEKWDFSLINRRAEKLAGILQNPSGDDGRKLEKRFEALMLWMTASQGERETVLARCAMKRSVFFHWWNNVSNTGILGLIEPGRELFRRSKIGPANEARLVIDRLQHPERPDSFYVRRLRSMGIEVKRDTVAKVFTRWTVKTYSSKFVSNLQRLDTLEEKTPEPPPEPTHTPTRMGDENFVHRLRGMREYPLQTASPGLLTLWAYIEELGLFPMLDAMGLTRPIGREKYSWFDVLLFDIARRFYGIPSLSAACEHEGAELAFLTHLYKAPCNDTALNVLAGIDEKQVQQIRRWLVDRLAQLGLATGRDVAFDFHHIDQDVQFAELRNIGRGPSPKKKLCYTGFRPHICWDIGSGSLLAAEFRKSSARGTSTVKPFCREYILPTFRELFDTVYIDSEYTGKHVWNFVLDDRDGMHAHLTGCLKQNALVRKARDSFLTRNAHCDRLWCYYDDDHVYANRTFPVQWTPASAQDGSHHTLKLTCVVKKHVVTGKMRCFGTSKHHLTTRQILEDYSSRWTVENGIKDLIGSYFLDNCPGTDPHSVDVHFLSVSICRSLYRMIERDLGDSLTNSDGSAKTLHRMREALFRQGPARISLREDTLGVEFMKAYTPTRTQMLTRWLRTLCSRHQDGLRVLGGLKLDFVLRPPLGEEYRNAGRKTPLNLLAGAADAE